MAHAEDILRDEVRRAGVTTRRVRWFLFGGVLLLLAGLVSVDIVRRDRFAASLPGDEWRAYFPDGAGTSDFFEMIEATVLAPVAGAVLGLSVAFGYRWQRRRQLRKRMAALSPCERSNTLLALQEETGDTAKLVASLRREFGIPTEITPAVAPDGRGDEPTPG